MESLPFRIGDKAFDRRHGVAEITGIESHDLGGSKQTFYVLRILDNSGKLMVPTGTNGLREIMSPEEADEVFGVLRVRALAVEATTWNRQQRVYNEKIDSGDPKQIAQVLRDLYLIKNEKDLSFGQNRILGKAKSRLVKELSLARGMCEEEIEAEFTQIFHA